MDYFENLLNLFQNATIENFKINLYANTTDSFLESIIKVLKFSFIIFEEDIIIKEILLKSKKSLKYSLISKSTSTINCKNTKYGTHLTGKLKVKFVCFFKLNFHYILFKNCKLFLEGVKISQQLEVIKNKPVKYLRKRNADNINLSKLLLVGQFNNEFIVFSNSYEIFVVDQHGLHERILYEQFKKKFEDKEAKSKACRNAIKFGNNLKFKIMHFLLNELKKCKHPFICAHGRPIILKIKQN